MGSLKDRFLGRRGGDFSTVWALKDVSFVLEPGQVMGVVGRNGSGKTTLLKLLSRVTSPTSGRIQVNGRVSALIELGAGFHPELTGRENVYLNGIILGLTRKEIDRRFESIVAFAELEDFIDTPVKRYSSGMYARLGFAVAAHSEPDLLLVDEVLSVGDSSFQDKCLDFMHSYVNGGKTTIFVSHDLYAIEQLCNSLIWIDQGRVIARGDPSLILDQYMSFLEARTEDAVEEPAGASKGLRIRRLRVTDGEGVDRRLFMPGEDVAVEVEYEAEITIEQPHFCIWVSDSPAPRPLVAANMLLDGCAPTSVIGRGTVKCIFKAVPFMPRAYYVWLEIWGSDRSAILFRWQRLARFQVVDHRMLAKGQATKGLVRFSRAHAPIRVQYEWHLAPGDSRDRGTSPVGGHRQARET